jgi:hypothetical protein
VKIVGKFFDRRVAFGITIYNRSDDIRAAAPAVEPAGLNLDMLKLKRSAIADDCVDRPEFLCRSMQSSTTRRVVASRKEITPLRYAVHRARCNARMRFNQQLVFIELSCASTAHQPCWDVAVLFIRISRP